MEETGQKKGMHHEENKGEGGRARGGEGRWSLMIKSRDYHTKSLVGRPSARPYPR